MSRSRLFNVIAAHAAFGDDADKFYSYRHVQETSEQKAARFKGVVVVLYSCLFDSDLPPITKSFYIEHAEVTAQTDEQVATLRANKFNISVENRSKDNKRVIPKPIWRFEHAFEKYRKL